MTTLYIVFLVLGVSTLINLSYLISAFVKKSTEMKISGFIMLFSPPAGTIYYLGQFIVRKIYPKKREIQLDDISFSKERHNRIQSPDTENEMQSVPLEELFLVSTEAEKRRRLLSELKKDNVASYMSITKAFDNDDPETSHYAAAAIANVKAGFENEIREFDSRYEHNTSNTEFVRLYSDYVLSYLRSGILDLMEIKKFSYLYLNLMTSKNNTEDFLNEDDYVNIVDRAIFTGDYPVAEHWAEISFASQESERSYLNLLKVYFYTNRSERFFDTLDSLKKSNIPLSQEGLDLVRFFIKPNSLLSERSSSI